MNPSDEYLPGRTLRHYTRFADVLRRVSLPFQWEMILNFQGTRCHLQVSDPKPICNVTGQRIDPRKSRKWFLSPHMTDGEIVQTAFKAVMTAIEHEAREMFLYRGQAIFDPHYDIEKLVALRSQPDALKEREPA